jgi:GNAT superfamily N-acetyltransferase
MTATPPDHTAPGKRVVVSDGRSVHVRALRADDCARLTRLFEQLSDESVYFRFFSPTPRSTAAQLELKGLDGTDHVALVALVGDEIVAVARYDRLASTEAEAEAEAEAEVALEVADAQQGRGIGTLLLKQLAMVARTHHIRTLSAVALPGNAKLFGMLADTGWPLERHFDAGAVRLRVQIDHSPDPSQATARGSTQS